MPTDREKGERHESIGDQFTAYFEIEAVGQWIGLVSCLKCGAALVIGDKDFRATKAHLDWHAENGR